LIASVTAPPSVPSLKAAVRTRKSLILELGCRLHGAPLQLGSFHTLASHPIDDFVVGVIKHTDMVRPFNRKKFQERKFARSLATHSNRNHVVIGAMENRHPWIWIPRRDFPKIFPVIVTFDEQTRDPAAKDCGSFLAQSRKRRDQHDLLHAMMRRKIKR